jgi:hypothetical protein
LLRAGVALVDNIDGVSALAKEEKKLICTPHFCQTISRNAIWPKHDGRSVFLLPGRTKQRHCAEN